LGRSEARHTPFPNFGKVEYFSGCALTDILVFCPTETQAREARMSEATSGVLRRTKYCGSA
jgi:hypothetical protein